MNEEQNSKSRPDEGSPTRDCAFNHVQYKISTHIDRVFGIWCGAQWKWQLFCFELRFETRNCRRVFLFIFVIEECFKYTDLTQ